MFSAHYFRLCRSILWINSVMRSELCRLSGCVDIHVRCVSVYAKFKWDEIQLISPWRGGKFNQREVTKERGRERKDERTGDSILQLHTSCSSPDIITKTDEKLRACTSTVLSLFVPERTHRKLFQRKQASKQMNINSIKWMQSPWCNIALLCARHLVWLNKSEDLVISFQI